MVSARLRNSIVTLLLLLAALALLAGSPRASGTFAPTISLETSTTRAAAHPDARITIDMNGSTEALKGVTIDLPSGMMGSLNAAVPCPQSVAAAKQCGDGSHQDAKVGDVINFATVDESDVVLRGSVYLTEALPGNEEPAGLQIVVPAAVGGVDMGDVVVDARVQIRHGDLSPSWEFAPTGTVGAITGVRTVVDDIPRSITDVHARTVNFLLKRLVVDLRSNQSSPRSPLLTNPSSCGPSQVSLDATGYDGASSADTESYSATQCDDVHVSDADFSFDGTNHGAGKSFSFTQTIEFADEQPAVKRMKLQFPPSIAVNFPSFGDDLNQCPTENFGSTVDGGNVFTPIGCPPEAKIAKVRIETPLLPDPLFGDLYLIVNSPLPYLGIYVDPMTDDDQPPADQNNPAGVAFGVFGSTESNSYLTSGCTLIGGACRFGIAATFDDLPDVPIKKITVTGSDDSRAGVDENGDPIMLTGKFLKNASKADSNCQPDTDIGLTFTSWTSGSPTSGRGAGVAPYTITGCNARNVVLSGSPYGENTSAPRPTLSYTGATDGTGSVATTASCGIDTQMALTSCDPDDAGAGDFTPSSDVDPGLHYFFTLIPASTGQFNHRSFVRSNPDPEDTTSPIVTLDDEPANPTADTTPSVDFSADEDAYFQCALDDGPFLPCGNQPADPNVPDSDSGTYTVQRALIPSDDLHTISVRAQDQAGNLSSVVTTSFTVEPPFTPSFSTTVSDHTARAHPDLDVTIENPSHEDLDDVEFNLPDGFFGAITGVAELCKLADAASGNCPMASKVGTVSAEAAVDESTIRVSGNVFLTDPIDPATEPASLSIKISPAVQSVVFDDIIVPAQLKLRGNAKGIDTFTLDLPHSADNDYGELTEFDLRKVVLKLRTGSGAPYPLLTNPSYCGPLSFTASFSGRGGGAHQTSEPFSATGCDALPFSPVLNITQSDSDNGTTPGESSPARRVNVNFNAQLATSPDAAGIRAAQLTLPRPLTIDVGHLPAPCLQEQADLKICPASSAIGTATATSPLLTQPLTGTVYVLKSPSSLPRLLVALRGRISVDLIADNEFVNVNQIQTTFSDLPDTPISSFSMNINRFLMTREDACDTPTSAWNIVGAIGGHNGAASPVNIPLTFDCPQAFSPVFADSFKNRGNKSTWSSKVTAQSGQQIRKLTVKLPKGVKFNAKATAKKKLAKYVKVTADGRQVKAKCIKAKGSSLQVGFCGKRASVVSITFKKGALKVKTKKKKLKFKVTVVDSAGKKQRAKDVG